MEQQNNIIKKCEICASYAKIICYDCMTYFCDSCSKFIHSKENNSNHKNEQIDLLLPIDTKCPAHSKNPLSLFCVEEKGMHIIFILKYIFKLIELCCGLCIYKNLHNNHKVIEINDENELKKENITIEDSMKEFDKFIDKTNELKNQIEKEINDINKLYDKTIDELKKTFEKRHEKLVKEESDLTQKLQNEVTKIKEKLEINLQNVKEEIKISEKINKAVVKMSKEEKNMIKILSYISKINKNKKGMNSLFQELMISSKFDFNEKENNINFQEYYFNGAPIPSDIEYKDNIFIGFNNIELKWKINDIKNLDKNKIKYKLEYRQENEDFKHIYEGEKNEFIINNLKNNTNYEIRICSIYNNIDSLWSEIKKITTPNSLDSSILSNTNQKNEFLQKIYEWSGYKKMELLYRGTRDGMFSKNFHEKCDGKGPTITLFRNDKGNIFGGYLPIPWKNTGGYQNENRCFIFTLTNIYNIPPTKFNSKNNGHEVNFDNNYGPCFYDTWSGGNLNSISAYFGDSYQDTTGKGNSMFTGNDNSVGMKITLNEVEVFKIK